MNMTDTAKRGAWDELYAQLNPEQRDLLQQIDADSGRVDDEHLDRFLDALARHFPGLEPAIRAVARHVFDSNVGTGPECGLGRKQPPVLTVHGCSGVSPAAEVAEAG